ncbi:MAG: TrmH family RNA methyltransferase [bacterium]
MRQFKTERRLKRLEETLIRRQHALTVVLENIHDPHNVSAIFRTCDAAGVPLVHLLYTIEKFPGVHRISSASGHKWVEREKHKDTTKCFEKLRENGFKIYASLLSDQAMNLYDIDLTQKVALVFGNEHRGVSKESEELADEVFYIPMNGMIQSLNVSVATAVTLYEAYRQRFIKGMYESPDIPEEVFSKKLDEWCAK